MAKKHKKAEPVVMKKHDDNHVCTITGLQQFHANKTRVIPSFRGGPHGSRKYRDDPRKKYKATDY